MSGLRALTTADGDEEMKKWERIHQLEKQLEAEKAASTETLSGRDDTISRLRDEAKEFERQNADARSKAKLLAYDEELSFKSELVFASAPDKYLPHKWHNCTGRITDSIGIYRNITPTQELLPLLPYLILYNFFTGAPFLRVGR